MDKLGQLAYSNPDLLFYYKGLVPTPPLQMVDDVLGIQRCSNKSKRLNSAVNTFVELEKLTLSKKKCHNVHVGKDGHNCPDLKVHGDIMINSKEETYLGDKIHKSGLLKHTIDDRVAKGYGAVTSILAIVNEVPLAHWRIQAGLHLREAMFLNGTLFNSEAWQGISDAEEEQLEKVDEALLRGILKAHSKVPLEALHLETGTISVKYILKSRRLCYLYTILNRDDEELIKEVYNAQKENPVNGDYCKLVDADSTAVNLQLTESQILSMKEKPYKDKVKSKVRHAAFTNLMKEKVSHSKMDNIQYTSLQLQEYLYSPLFDSESSQMLFALRTRTVRGVKNDFRGMFADVLCPLGCGNSDTLENILTCSVLQNKLNSEHLVTNAVKFEDIYSPDVTKQRQITELYLQLIDIREKTLNSSPVAITGPVH